MAYAVKEMFLTLQGEGAQTGRVAVFCRFSGCNLWSGRERDRATAACRFCDTDFVGVDGLNGGRFATPEALMDQIEATWCTERAGGHRLIVFTGGEPLLQLDKPLIDAAHERGFEVAVESNGTVPAPEQLDWICVSPKPRSVLRQRSGNELKFVFPQEELEPAAFESLSFDHFFLQPMDGPNQPSNLQAAIQYCLSHPQWRLSLQTHKMIGVP